MKTTLDSINLFSSYPVSLKEFYINVFDLTINEERSEAPGFFLIEGGKGCNILIQDAAATLNETGAKGFELGFEVGDVEGIKTAVLAHGGNIINDTQQMDWGVAITVSDPEGHLINAYKFRF